MGLGAISPSSPHVWTLQFRYFRTEISKNHDSHRRDRILRDFLHWIFATFSRFSGALLTKLQIKPGERAKNPVESLQWRRRPEIADFCPLSWSNWSWLLECFGISVKVCSQSVKVCSQAWTGPRRKPACSRWLRHLIDTRLQIPHLYTHTFMADYK